jgi:uncharacterized protein
MHLRPHWRTIAPTLRHLIRPLAEPPGTRHWEGEVRDALRGPLPLRGRLHEVAGATELLVVVHGLGGNHDSFYAVQAARAAAAAGVSSLRLSLRGAIDEPRDLYHAGLSADVHAALAAPEFQAQDAFYLMGYSMGGNLALCAASEESDPRLRAVAASCAPIDLDACCRHIDDATFWLYRKWILDALKEQYRTIARHGEVPVPPEEIEVVRGFRHWDELTIAPRFGFESAEDYYRRMSALHRLPELRVPALLVQSRHDPIVAAGPVERGLGRGSGELEVHWVDNAGHLGLPRGLRLELGLDPRIPGGFEAQALAWMRRQR